MFGRGLTRCGSVIVIVPVLFQCWLATVQWGVIHHLGWQVFPNTTYSLSGWKCSPKLCWALSLEDLLTIGACLFILVSGEEVGVLLIPWIMRYTCSISAHLRQCFKENISVSTLPVCHCMSYIHTFYQLCCPALDLFKVDLFKAVLIILQYWVGYHCAVLYDWSYQCLIYLEKRLRFQLMEGTPDNTKLGVGFGCS